MLNRRFRKVRARFLAGLLSAGLATSLTGTGFANPSGANVRSGQVNISGGVHTQIQQLTDRAIVDWQSFSIGTGESVRFFQPSDLSVILNRVTGGDPSQILGQLSANGNVFLINPNGILFGPTATVNVGGLVASTLNITDQDFLNGNYNFFQEEGRELAAVINQGEINITDAGYAVLVAPTVINEGTIVARAGNIVLASGEQATLNLDGRDLIHFALSGKVSEGTVLLAPGMMSESIAQTLGVDSARRADRFEQMADGSVRMVNSSGTLVQSGTVSADGRDGLDAGSVILDSADYTLLTNGSATTASGQGAGSSGGEVFVLSDMSDAERGLTTVEEGALIAAKGGDQSGDAGFAEISGDQVQLRGEVDLTRTSGKGGTLLLDPGQVFIVDDSYVQPVDGNTYYTDLFIEGQLNSGTDVSIYSTGESIQSIIRSTSGGSDTGVQATSGSGSLSLDTLNSNPMTMETGTFIDLGDDDYDLLGLFDLFAASDIDIGASTISSREFTATAQGGALTINGASIDTRLTVGDETDGGSVSLTADGLLDIDNTTILFNKEFGAGATLSLRSFTGNIEVDDGTFTSEFLDDPMSGARDYFSDIDIMAGGDVTITNTAMGADNISLVADFDGSITQTVTGGSLFEAENDFSASVGGTGSVSLDRVDAGGTVDIDGDSVNLQDALVTGNQILIDAANEVNVLDADIRANTGTGSLLSITAGTTIDGNPDALLSALQAPTINLSAGTGSVDVAIDTSVLTNLTVSANGDVVVRESPATTNAQGFNLIRGTGNIAVQSATGDIEITSTGLVGLGNDSPTGDPGPQPIISASNGSVSITADRILDQNSTLGVPGGVEIVAGGPIVLNGTNGIGLLETNGQIDVQTNNLTAIAEGANAPINIVSNEDLEFVDLRFNGGIVSVTDSSGARISHDQVAGSGPNILSLEQSVTPFLSDAKIRVTSLADILIHDFDVLADQQIIITASNGASILNGDTTNSGSPNITRQSGNGFIALSAEGDLGTESDFLSLESDLVLVNAVGANSNLFLDLRPPSASPSNPTNLQGVVTGDPLLADMITDPLTSTFAPEGFGIDLPGSGDIVVDAAGDLFLPGGVTSGGSGAFSAIGDIDTLGFDFSLGASPSTLLINADTLVMNSGSFFADNIGLELQNDFGAEGALERVDNLETLALGTTPGTGYFLRTNTEFGDEVTIVESLSVRNKTVSGNEVGSLEIENLTGDIIVDAPVDSADSVVLRTPDDTPAASIIVNEEVSADNRIQLEAFQDIRQGSNGLLDTTDVVLSAGGDIGSFSTGDLLTSASTLAVNAGGSAYVRNGGPALTIRSDTGVPAVGAGQDFRVRNDLDDLIVSTDIGATNIALATGNELEIGAQAIGGDIILNNSITASGNLVLLAGGTGNIVQNGGVLQANQMGLGSNGTVGTPGSGITLLNTNDLALFSLSNVLNPDPSPTPVSQVTSVGVTVNQGMPGPGQTPTPEVPDGSIVVEVVLQPSDGSAAAQQFEGLIDGSVFAQDDVDLVEDYLRELLNEDSYWDGIFDPTHIPGGWWDDDDFLRRKFRNKSKK